MAHSTAVSTAPSQQSNNSTAQSQPSQDSQLLTLMRQLPAQVSQHPVPPTGQVEDNLSNASHLQPTQEVTPFMPTITQQQPTNRTQQNHPPSLQSTSTQSEHRVTM